MRTMNKKSAATGGAVGRFWTAVATVKKSVNLLIAVGGLVLFLFAGTVLAGMGHHVWAGLIGISGLMVFMMGVSGYLVYRLLSAYY